MRRTLVALLALFAAVSAPAAAQTCLGLASFSNGPIQVAGHGSFTQGVNSFGGSLGYGLPHSVFGSAAVSTTSYDVVNASSLGIGATVGYQMTLGKSAQAQLCPTASFGVGNGPDDQAAGINESRRSANVGFSVGTSMAASPRMQIVPNAGLSLAYGKSKREGVAVVETSDTYGLARLGVGVVISQNMSVRPSVDIPLGLAGSDPTFGLTLGYNFGRKQ